jgi:hypothetical protein
LRLHQRQGSGALCHSTCTTGIISSATVDQITQVTDFLKKNDNLKPFDIKVLNSGQ